MLLLENPFLLFTLLLTKIRHGQPLHHAQDWTTIQRTYPTFVTRIPRGGGSESFYRSDRQHDNHTDPSTLTHSQFIDSSTEEEQQQQQQQLWVVKRDGRVQLFDRFKVCLSPCYHLLLYSYIVSSPHFPL